MATNVSAPKSVFWGREKTFDYIRAPFFGRAMAAQVPGIPSKWLTWKKEKKPFSFGHKREITNVVGPDWKEKEKNWTSLKNEKNAVSLEKLIHWRQELVAALNDSGWKNSFLLSRFHSCPRLPPPQKKILSLVTHQTNRTGATLAIPLLGHLILRQPFP